MRLRLIEDRLCGIEAEPVEVKFVDPVPGVRCHELPRRRGAIIEIDRVSPFVVVARREIRARKLPKIISVRPQVVVDDIKEHAEAELMGAIDETAEIVGVPYDRLGANRSTPSYPQPKRPANSAIGIISIVVMPMSVSAGR